MTKRKTAGDFDQELLDLYDEYAHGGMGRREFMARASKYAVGGVTAAALLDMLSPRYALAQQVDPADPSIKTARIEYRSARGHGAIRAYLTRPAAAAGKLPGVVVVHENRGLNPYIEDVARRLAVAGFMALAPDGLSPSGGYPGNDDDGRTMQRQLDRKKLREDFFAAFQTLRTRPDSTGKVGVVGFCTAATSPTPWRCGFANWRRRCRSMAASREAPTWPGSGRRCCCTTPASTSGPTRAARPTRRR